MREDAHKTNGSVPALMLAYDFYPSEGGIQTLMRSLVTAETPISWTILSRKVGVPTPGDTKLNIKRATMRPQLRIIDRFWLKMRHGNATVPELLTFQMKRKALRLSQKISANFIFADQINTASCVKAVAKKLDIPWGIGVYGKELLKDDPRNRRILSAANVVIACSEFTKELAVSRGAQQEKTFVVHPTVDTMRFSPPENREETRRELGLEGHKVLLTVAHLVPRKGHEQVIRALPIIRSACPDVIYLVVGQGPNENALSALARELGVIEAVRFCGYVSERELPVYYGAADIHVMPSSCDGDVEGFGISFIEAAACGTPSIGSRSGGIPDAIVDGETGYLIDPGDIDDLSEKILLMLKNGKLSDQMGSAGRVSATKYFSAETFAQDLTRAFGQTVLSR